MSRSTQSFDAAILPVVLWIVLLAVPAVAQQPASNTSDQEIYADFYATDKSLRQLHQQKLAEIDERYKTALRAYRDENVKRAQSLTDLNTSDHKALKEKGLKGTQRQTEYVRIQAEDKKRRAEYAEWRDSTARRLQEEHANARREEIERHQAEMERLLADRKAKLAGIRSLNDSIFLTPDGDGSESDAEVDVDDLEMLGRADETDGSSDAGASDADSETASRVSESLPSQSLPPLDGVGNDDLLGDQGQTLPVPAGIEPQQAGTRIAVAFPNTGDVVETGDSGASTQAFELSVTTAVSNTIQRFNFRVLHADGTIVVEKEVCGMGAASSPECGNNPRFNDFIDLSAASGGTYRLAVQALDSEGDAVSRVVEFQIPYRAVIAPVDVEIAEYDPEVANDECRWLVTGRLIDWDGNPVASQSLFVESRRHKGNGRVKEEREWTDWKGKKWGAVTTNAGGHFSLRSQKLDNCGGKREFRVFTQVGAFKLNLGQPVLTAEATIISDPLVLPRAESNTSFDILTYNVALISGGGRENRSREYRAENIGRRLHRYHVVVINEAFRNRARRKMLNELWESWNEAGYKSTVVGDGGPLLDNGGVDIATRLPVIEEHATEYSKARDADRLGDKGAVHARVRANNGQLIDIFATHLQAGGDREDIRAHQIGELRDFIMRHSDPDVPFLVLGDMNLKTPEARSNAIRILLEARPGVRDAWQWKGSGECVTKPDSGRCLDFIYVGNVSGELPLMLDRIAVRKFEDAATRRRYLSDHFGVEAGFTITSDGTSP